MTAAICSSREPVQRPVFWIALACTASVDAAAGVFAASIAILSWPGTDSFAMVFVAGVTLGAAWAQAVDPRTRLAAPPIVRAECLAAAGAIVAWALPGALLAAGVLTGLTQTEPLSWWPGLLLGSYAVMVAPMPLNVLVIRNLVGAGGLLATVGTMARRAVVCCAVLLTAAATLLVVSY